MPRQRTQMWDLARAVIEAGGCPDCGQSAGNSCLNLRTAGTRRPEFIGLPHAARYPAGDRNIGSPENGELLNGA